jgi:hypothetical protein
MRELMNIVGIGCQKVDTKKQDEIETVIVTAVIALLAALGLIFSFAVLTGADIFEWNPVIALSSYFIFSGIIWGILIIKNH